MRRNWLGSPICIFNVQHWQLVVWLTNWLLIHKIKFIGREPPLLVWSASFLVVLICDCDIVFRRDMVAVKLVKIIWVLD